MTAHGDRPREKATMNPMPTGNRTEISAGTEKRGPGLRSLGEGGRRQ